MIRFIHTADIHFGVENYGRIDPVTGIHTRLLDFQKALDACIDHAIAEQVDFFLFCGDAYKTTNPSPTQQRLLMRCFLRLYQANIPLISVVGNHDNPLSFGKATTLDIFGQLPLEGFYVIAKPQWFTLQTKSGPVQIVGMPWPSRQMISLAPKHEHRSAQEITAYLSEAVASIIANFAQQLNPEIPTIFAGHLTVSSGMFSGSEKRAIYGSDPFLLPSQLAIAPFDYVALGHLHRYQNLNEEAYPAVVYSGSLERIDFGERKEEKGFCSVTIHHKGNTTHDFIKIKTRPFIQVYVQLTGASSHTEQVVSALQKHNLIDAIVKIIYQIPAGKRDTVDTQQVMRACHQALCVASITPIAQAEVRQKRGVGLTTEMDLPTALRAYFSTKPTLQDRQEELIKKTLALAEEPQKSPTPAQQHQEEGGV